jgi:hypothetical protein
MTGFYVRYSSAFFGLHVRAFSVPDAFLSGGVAQARAAWVSALVNYVKAKSGTVARESQIPLEYLQQNRNN